MDELLAHLKSWERRRRWLLAGLWLPRGLLVGLSLAALAAAIARLRPWLMPEALLGLTAGLAGAGLLLAGVGVMLARRSLLQQARGADHQFHLQERVATAIEIYLAQLTPPVPWGEQQLQDTLRAARRVDVVRAMPWRWPMREMGLLALTTLLLILALVLPNPQTEQLRQQQAVAQAIAGQTAALEALLEELRQTPGLTPTQEEALTTPLEEALQELQAEDLSQEEVTAVLSEAEADLRALASDGLPNDLAATLAEAGASLAETPAGRALGQALQAGDLSAAAAAAFDLADELPDLTPAETAALMQQMDSAATALAEADPELATALAEAAESLNQGDIAAAQAALRQAGALLQQRVAQLAAAEAAAQVAAGRQAVAQAGQPETAGEANTPGEGGDSLGEESPGSEANSESAGGASVSSGEESNSSNAPGVPGPGGGHVENLFVPPSSPLIDAPGVSVELPAVCQGNPEACGQLVTEQETPFRDEQSRVPYDQVFGDYRDQAYAALEDDYVPLGLKDFIRDYFSSLEP